MKHRYINLMGLAALMTLAGCAKENVDQDAVTVPEGALMVVAEGSGAPGSKVTVEGSNVYWQNNEPVRVNDQHDRSLTIEWTRYSSGDKYAAFIRGIEPVNAGESYYVMTPTNLTSMTTEEIDAQYDRSVSGEMRGTLKIRAPRKYMYKYSTTSNRQMIDGLPMYGKASSGDNFVEMKHLTAIVSVDLTNSARRPIVLDSIEVSCGNYRLCGEYNYTIRLVNAVKDPPEPTYISPSSTPDSLKTVCLDFTSATDQQRTIGTGASGIKSVQIPIMPVPKRLTDSITIKIYGKTKWDGYEGTTMYQSATPAPGTEFCIKKTVSGSYGLLNSQGIRRNDLVHAPMTITSEAAGTDKGIFTLGPSASAPKGVLLLSESSTPPDNTYRLLSKIELQYLLETRGDENTARFVVINRRPSGQGGYVRSALCIFPDGVQISDLPSEVHPYVNTNEVPQQIYQLLHLNPDWAKGCFVLPLIDYYDYFNSYTNYRHQVGNEWLYAEMQDNYTPTAYTWTEPEFWGSRYCGWFYDRYLYVKTLP